jgi:hypothetical protein
MGAANTTEVRMLDEVMEKSPVQVRGRPFPKGRSGNPAGRRLGCRNKATMAAQALLAGEAERLTRKAIEAALAGDQTAISVSIRCFQPESELSLQVRCRCSDPSHTAQP